MVELNECAARLTVFKQAFQSEPEEVPNSYMKQTMSMMETFQVITEVILEARVMRAFVGEELSEHCAAHLTVEKWVH